MAVEACMSLPLILAQHIFTRFMRSICKHLPRDCLGQGLPQAEQDVEVTGREKFVPESFEDTWRAPTLRHRGLSKVAYQIERTGLGDAMEIFLCMIPPLSSADLLPNEVILRILPQKGPDRAWAELAECYQKLLQHTITSGSEEHFCYEAVVASVDFILMVSQPYDDCIRPSGHLEDALESLISTLVHKFSCVLAKLFPIYGLQRRLDEVKAALERCGLREAKLSDTRDEVSSEFPKDLQDWLRKLRHTEPQTSFKPLWRRPPRRQRGDDEEGGEDDGEWPGWEWNSFKVSTWDEGFLKKNLGCSNQHIEVLQTLNANEPTNHSVATGESTFCFLPLPVKANSKFSYYINRARAQARHIWLDNDALRVTLEGRRRI
jgi:hypothetical protein